MTQRAPTPRQSPRRRYPKGEQRRSEILAAALEVIARVGVGPTTIGAIGAAVGLSPAGLLHYFGSRTQLFIEVLEERDRLGHDPADRSAGILPLIDSVRRNAQQPGLTALFVTLAADSVDPSHEANTFFADHYADLIGRITAEVLAAQTAGTLRSDVDADAVARLIVAATDGLQLQWLHDPDFAMDRVLTALLALAAPA